MLRFLDGATTPAEEVALMGTTRLRPMVAATAGDAAARLRAASTRPGGRDVDGPAAVVGVPADAAAGPACRAEAQ